MEGQGFAMSCGGPALSNCAPAGRPLALCEQEAGRSRLGPTRRRTYIPREREDAEQRLIDDYFGDDEFHPKYPQRYDATGRLRIGPILKCTSAIRQLAYDTSPDAFDEYLQITEPDIPKTYELHEQKHGLPGMLGSIDSVADQKLWIWHAYFRVPWENNDLNVLYGSLLFDDELADRAPECPFVVNGYTYRKAYYLADGIYPTCNTLRVCLAKATVAGTGNRAVDEDGDEDYEKRLFL
nr:hypothetical protein [Tanacetum cinerariifolium]